MKLSLRLLIEELEREGERAVQLNPDGTGYIYLNGFRDGTKWFAEQLRQKGRGLDDSWEIEPVSELERTTR